MSAISAGKSGLSSSNSNDNNVDRIELDYLLCFRDDSEQTRCLCDKKMSDDEKHG